MNTKFKIITIIVLLLSVFLIKAQGSDPFGFHCIISGEPGPVNNPVLPGGVYKPASIIDYTLELGAYFPVLIVYVQFTDDPGPDCDWWHKNQAPNYMGNVIATEKSTNYGSNWYDAYDADEEPLSDYWMEVSRGKLHLVGQEVWVKLPQNKDWYENNGNIPKAMEDLFVALQNDPTINWRNYDFWSKVGNTFVYGDGDGYVDMMYIVARSNPCSNYLPCNMNQLVGYFRPNGVRDCCTHGIDHTVYNQGDLEIKARAQFSETGSGFQISPGFCPNGVMYAPLQKLQVVSFSEHEHGHYLVGPEQYYWEYHLPYSKINNYAGPEEFLSPYELFRFGYHEPQVVDFVETDYPIGDWTSRESNESQILKVPIGTPTRNEFFIIANRQKVSYYDRIMWGDTCRGDPYFDLGSQIDYGKGSYIYHAYPGEVSSEGYPWSIHIDQECADGLWNWEHTGFAAPDWDPNNPWLPVYTKTQAVYDLNDITGAIYYNPDGLNNRDGKSVSKFFLPDFHHVKWFSIGKKETQYVQGTDRYWTNLMLNSPLIVHYEYEDWTSREFQGDRWDAWKVGYNQVFSPYSSPSTYDWGNSNSGIFIYLESQEGMQADFKIYKSGVNYTEEQILQLTPPAKPMNLKVEPCFQSPSYPYYFHNKLTWNHNREPDMLRDDGMGGFYKRYQIYKYSSPNVTDLPDENNPQLLATVDIDETQQPEYVDYSEPSICTVPPDANCPPVCWVLHAVRYRIEAIDIYETPSVKSDFASSFNWNVNNIGGKEGGDNLPKLPVLPKTFSLLQNYPNPFNPSTEIKFALPKNSFVTINVYNVLGELVETLIENELKDAGYYTVQFDGTNFSSGIYFYTIEAGDYKASRKMVLVK